MKHTSKNENVDLNEFTVARTSDTFMVNLSYQETDTQQINELINLLRHCNYLTCFINFLLSRFTSKSVMIQGLAAQLTFS